MDTTQSDNTKHYAWLGKLIAEDRNSKDSTCDLVLESEGKKFPVHKNIMMLVSKYFKKMFTIEMKEKYEGIVKMLQIPHQRLSNLIEFIYSGRIKITEKNVLDILDDAEYTELEALKEICKTTLLKLVSADNCLKLRAYAQRYNLDEVFDKTNQEITTSFAAVVRQKDFVQLGVDDMSAVIKLRNKTSEEAAFTGIIQWVNHNPLQREDLFVNLFLQLDITAMSSDFVAQVSTENLVRKHAKCSNKLVDALVVKLKKPTSHVTDRKFLLMNGEQSLGECVIYDVITKQQVILPSSSTGTVHATSVKVGNKVYLIGGYEGSDSKSCSLIDLKEKTGWIEIPKLLNSRLNCGLGYIEGYIYVTGGNFTEDPASCEKFDIFNNKWIIMKSMLHRRSRHGSVVCNDSLYCIGGSDGRNRLSSCERYDVRNDVWSEIAPLNQAREGLACVVLNEEIYAIGGLGINCYLSTVEKYNPQENKWKMVAKLQHERHFFCACVVGNKIFAIGGNSKKGKLKSVEVYDPTSNTWTNAFEIKSALCEATVVAI